MKSTRNKTSKILAGGIGIVMLLAACSGQGTKSNDGTDSSGRVTIKFGNGFTGPDRPTVEKLVAAFNSSQSKVKVDMTIDPWDVFYDKLLPSIGSGKGPDLMGMDSSRIPNYASRGVLQPMDDYFSDSGTGTGALVKSAVDAASWEGKRYGAPMNFTTTLLYWNKAMFKKAGIDNPPASWDEFIADAKVLTKDANNDGRPEQYGLALGDHQTVPMWPILLWGGGGGVVTQDGKTSMLDDPKTLDTVKMWTSLLRKDKISPIGLTGADADKLFQSKKAAMEIVGPWMTSGFSDAGIDFGLAPAPEGPAGPVTLGTSVSFAVNAKTSKPKQDAARAFVTFWNSKTSQVTWSKGSGFPPNRTDVPASELSSNRWVADFAKYADQSRFYLINVKEFSKVNDSTFEPALQQVLSGGDADKIFKSASDKIQQILDSNAP